MRRHSRALLCGELISLCALLLCGSASLADDLQQHQPRTLGQLAVLHVYYYAPKTLEITYVDSYLFKDVDACKAAIPKALMIAAPHASEGDLVSATCTGMRPPKEIKDSSHPVSVDS